MEYLYTVINFFLLAGIVFLVGRKTIVSIFRNRRERISRELDSALEISNDESPQPEALPRSIPAEELAADEMDSIRSSLEKETEHIKNMGITTRIEMHRDMLFDVHNDLIQKIRESTIRLLSKDECKNAIRAKEPDMLRQILSEIHLTPGDIAYLNTNSELYVTLRSAYPLPDEMIEQVKTVATNMIEDINGKISFIYEVTPGLIGGLILRIGDTVYDFSVAEQLYLLERKMSKDYISGKESPLDIFSIAQEDIEKFSHDISIYQLGRVITVSDGICWMEGLSGIMYGEVVEFVDNTFGMVLDIQPSRIGCVIYGDYTHIESGSRVRRVGRIASVPVGEVMLGRVVDALGNAIDGKSQIRTTESRHIECNAPSIVDRSSVCDPLHTGIIAIDSMIPIGKGQRELIIGDRQTGKTSIIIDTILNQRGKNVICIYVAIGQKDTTVADVRNKLEKYNAMKYTIIVCAPASASASLQYIAPFSATAMGEYFMYKGKDVLIVYDDLSKHAVAYRELSLLLHRPSGREAFPGDIFYLHSRLLERSAKLSPEMGGGSMTALPIIETLAGDISAYIPTNVISITDGQIFLDTELFYEGQRPAINVGLSVSRVGGAAQTKLMKQVSASLRMRLAQYRELSGFAQFGTDVDEDTRKVLDSGSLMMAALRQKQLVPLSDVNQAILIYAVSEGYASSFGPADMELFKKKLFVFLKKNYASLYRTLSLGKKMTDEVKSQLDDALAAFTSMEDAV